MTKLREIKEKHIDDALKILANEKYWRGEVFKQDPIKMKRKVVEIDYCERLIRALWEDRENYIKQPKIL